ncbi:MAG TPA: hypothetical protein VD788_03775 [Candidatus Polarisedimenticolaceae bacterium]|nr:hypothetical protein [Candidatus Polarisedimenticolaceae bacterium]
MRLALYAAALLTLLVGLAHSYLGERYILTRLFRRDDLPRLFGRAEFTRRTLRFAWHLTTISWWGFAAILVVLADPPATSSALGAILGCTFLAHAAVTIVASRGRHLAWPVFLAIGVIAIAATRG